MGHQVGPSISFMQLSLLVVILLFIGSAVADTIYSNNPSPGDAFTNLSGTNQGEPIDATGWNYNNVRGGATVGIRTVFPRYGKGSVFFHAPDQAKADVEYLGKAVNYLGNYYSVTKLGTFASLESFSYEWYRNSSSTVDSHYHPAIRVLLDADGDLTTVEDRGALVFELAYNPEVLPPQMNDVWVKSIVTNDSKVWRVGLVEGPFHLDDNDYDYDSTLADWKNSDLLKNAVVIGFSSGVGSGWTGDFTGAVDNIEWTFSSPLRTRTNNFEVKKVIPKPPEECFLNVFKNGCYYRGTCTRKWGECPALDICNGALELSTEERCKPACVGFGVFADCPVDLSKHNHLVFGAKLLVKGGVDKCAVHVKIELEDEQCNKYYVYVWITNECCDYSIVLAKFKNVNLCKITGLFLVTAFDLISHDECKEVVLVFDYIKFVHRPCYTVFNECTAYQYNGHCTGPTILYYWPCQPCATVLSNCEGYGRVLVIPCDTWGAGLMGYSQNLKEFKYLSFHIKSSVKVKIELGDGCGIKDCVYVDSTCGQWKCYKLCLADFCGVDLCDVTWQFMATKVGRCDNEVEIANIEYIY